MSPAQAAPWGDLIAAHYGTTSLVARVEAALRAAGFGEGQIAWDALAPLDQFHVGGAAATTALAARLGITAASRVLDIGCGLGGPSRHIASVYGCTVSGIDLNGPMVDVAILLTGRAGLADRVRHVAGDATRLPFEPEGFDFAWTQHVAMNIADRRALYVGVRAMLRPGGRFAMHDVVAGDGGPLHFPVPWARDPAASFVITAEATREALESAGLVVRDWIDATDAALEWFAAQPTAAGSRPDHLKPLALPLIMGPGFPTMTANLARNVREGRARFLQAVVERPV